MTIDFNPMSDDRYWNQEPVLLLIGNTVHEASFESSRHWFYLYNRSHFTDSGDFEQLPEYLDEDDERILGWAFARIDNVPGCR